jgi:VWFA-related protein
MKSKCLSMGAILALSAAAPLAAPGSAQVPQFKTEVSAIVVDVLVLDREGAPVAGLSREDFEVYEDGIGQEILNFDVIDWSSYVAREAPRPGEPPSPAPGAVNAFPRRFAFVINRQGARFGFLVRARKALESFVVESMADGDEAMVVDIGLSTRVLQEFVDSKEKTLATIRKLSAMEVEVDPGLGFGRATDFLEERASRNVYDTLEALGEALGNFPGRKIVLFMSPELNRTQNLITYLQDTVGALNQSNTTVYSVDIRGVEAISAEQAVSNAFAQPFFDEVGDVSRASSIDSFDFGGLFALAHQTGGRYFYNLNTFEPAVRRVGTENRRYYVLSYVSTNEALDGKYRKIEVRVARPELQVVARRGYFAAKAKSGKPAPAPKVASKEDRPTTPKAPSPPARGAAPDAPVSSGAPSAPRQVEVNTYLLPSAEGKVEVPVVVAFPLDLLRSDDGKEGARVAVVTIQDPSGNELARLDGPVDSRNFYISRRADLAPGTYQMGVRLESGGAVLYQGQETLEVPAGMEKRFGLSSLIPVLAPSPINPGGAAPLGLRPSTTLDRGEDSFLYFRVMPGEEPLEAEAVKIVFSIYRGDEEIRTTESREPPRFTGDGERGHPIVLRVPTADLSAGRYRIVVRVEDARLRRRATSEIEVFFQ